MQAFRGLCADVVLRPGDQVAIGRIASADLCKRVGDARACGFVREHDGAVMKTIGDALMAAFTDPATALDAALGIRDGIARFDREIAAVSQNEGVAIPVEIGLHSGACAARLQGESAGGVDALDEARADASEANRSAKAVS
jgi:class 3 adenylate cyclase